MWIRSQDKNTLAQFNCFSTGFCSRESYVFGRGKTTDLGVKLGAYNSQAEAIKVLDIIQDLLTIENKTFRSYRNGEEGYFGNTVFQMPEAGFSKAGDSE